MKFHLQYLLLISVVVFLSISDGKIQSSEPIVTLQYQPPKQASTRSADVKWATFKAKVDNFNKEDNRTFEMRYVYNMQFAKEKNAPLIIYVGGEWPIDQVWVQSGQVFEMARENQGAMFYLEHRFYGESLPGSDYSTENLQYLESRQAIEDIKAFIESYKSQKKYAKSKIVLFGCSYSASLAAWTKVTYPHLITATYSTSGPMIAQANMFEFMERATVVIRTVNNTCADLIKTSVGQMETLYAEEPNGSTDAQDEMGFCHPKPPYEPYDKAAIFQQFAAAWGNMIQTNPYQVQTECKRLMQPSEEGPIGQLAAYMKDGTTTCRAGGYDFILESYEDVSADVEGGNTRAFFYQQCNEFGWFVTTDSPDQLFGRSVKPYYFYQLCRDAFSDKFTYKYIEDSIDKTNEKYGGRNPKVTKSVFVYGNLDPWAAMGLQGDQLNDEAPVFHVDSGDHCWDMFAESDNDSPHMLETKRQTRAWIKKWLSEAEAEDEEE